MTVNTVNYLPHVDMDCFACGPENTHGLQMKFVKEGDILKSDLVIPSHLRGWSNLAHGGILSTILDEVMSWAAIHFMNRFILTKNMSVSFLKPVIIGTPVTAIGEIKERKNERNAVMEGKIFDQNGDLCAKSDGNFVLFTQEEFKKMGIVSDEVLSEMTEMFA
jgi:uncharacterized protein (TIGR00369 family)